MSVFRLWMQRQICTWNILGVPPLLNLTSRFILLSLSWISKTPSFHLVVPSSPHLMRMRTAPPLVILGTATAMSARGAQNSGSGHNWRRTDAARDLQQKPWQKTRDNIRRETQKRKYFSRAPANISDDIHTASGSVTSASLNKSTRIWSVKFHCTHLLRANAHQCKYTLYKKTESYELLTNSLETQPTCRKWIIITNNKQQWIKIL